MVTAYGSHLAVEIPYNRNIGLNRSEVPFGNLPLYVAGTTESPAERFTERADPWAEHVGLWPITDEAVARIFLNDMAFTVCEAMLDAGTRPNILYALVDGDMSQGPREVRTGSVTLLHRR